MTNKTSIVLLATAMLMALLPASKNLVAQAAPENPYQLVADHATVVVTDLSKETKFYEEALGFRVIGHGELVPGKAPFFNKPATVYRLVIPGYAMDIVGEKLPSRERPQAGDHEAGYLDVEFRSPAIAEVYKHLKDLGIQVRADKNEKSEIVHLTFHDPEGNQIGISVP